MAGLLPRAVLVTRETDYQRLLAVHATREQARFFLASRGQSMNEVAARHDAFVEAVRQVRVSLPSDWRVAKVQRADLDRFLFGPEDIVIAIGQDGLVANLAKYLSGQPVLGINPAPDVNEGVLVPLLPAQAAGLAQAAADGAASLERRSMALAKLDDGQTLQALNEIFVGHRTHQSARYRIVLGERSETHSSSGVIISTGTGTTGWARSIMTATGSHLTLQPTDRRLAFFVREAWPSVATRTAITSGALGTHQTLELVSNMNDGGVIFADGMEQDHLVFGWGRKVELTLSAQTLNLVQPD